MSGADEWLIDETRSLIDTHLEALDGELADVARGSQPLHHVVSHDDKQWFGEGRQLAACAGHHQVRTV